MPAMVLVGQSWIMEASSFTRKYIKGFQRESQQLHCLGPAVVIRGFISVATQSL
jgi:hypothetical protein